jgi:hypothetical protein
MPGGDPWERVDYGVPIRHYGRGAKHDFSWYFEGESLVRIETIDDVVDWLLECEYVQDPELFHEPDFWQHPRTFERLRRGDCEDHALWAWRKLIELGYDAELVSGRFLPWQPGVSGQECGHAWVIFRRDEERYLFETTSKDRSRVIRPLADAAAGYRPEYGVDRSKQRFAFYGVLLTMREREFGLPRPESVSRTG